MEQNKTGKYFKYAIGEVVLVVIGILIALSINNWNENKKIKNSEQQYLLALKMEFTFNKEELESIINLNKRNTDNILKIVTYTGPKNPEITEEEFGILLTRSLSKEIQFDTSQGVLDAIISSGKLEIFSNHDLKFSLSSWNGALNKVRLQEQELLNLRSRTIEMVRNKANLRKVLGPFLEQFGMNETKFEQGSLHLLKSVAFEGHMVGLATMSLNFNNKYYPKLIDEINKILLLIDDEIKENKG